jgi:hypothetical protein
MQNPLKTRYSASEARPTWPVTSCVRGESFVRARSLEEEPEGVVEVSFRHLSELDVPLAVRILRLEASFETRGEAEDAAVSAARTVRVMLRRATQFAPIECDATASFERVLAETVSSTYAWSLRALDALLGESTPSSGAPQVDLLLVDMIEACDVRGAFDPSTVPLQSVLERLLHAVRILSRATSREVSR